MRIPFFEGDLVRKGSLVFTASLAASLVSLAGNFVFSNVLGDEHFGSFKTVIYLSTFLMTLFDFGINTSLTKYISEFGGKRFGETKYLIIEFLKMKMAIYLLLFIVFFLLKDYVALYFLKDVTQSDLIVAGMVALLFGFFSTFSFISLGFQNFKVYSISNFLSSLVTVSMAIFMSQFGLFYMIIGYGLGTAIGNIPNMLYLYKKKIFTNQAKTDVKKIFLKFSLPIYPIELTAGMLTAVVPLLSLFFAPKLISYYSFAFMFYYASMLIPNSLSTILFPKVSELCGLKDYASARKILRKAALYYSFFVVLGLIFTLLFSEWFITAFSKDFLPSLFMFKVIVSLGFVFGFNVLYTNYLKGMGRLRRFALFTIMQNIVLIAVSFILVSGA
jgi:O-antigen/teichoic acid export membrane protein